MPRVLLHVCCAPCASHVIQELKNLGFSVTPFFYNPNIYPKSEYQKRLEEIQNYIKEIIEEPYDPDNWFAQVKGLEQEPERGKRCDVCFRLRLEKTAQTAQTKNFDYFASTLSISPHKDALLINQIGEELAEKYKVKFYSADWKKHGGYKKSCQIAKEHNFYRQNYCGCVYSH